MNKIIYTISFLLLVSISFNKNVFAQITPGSIAPNFNLTDLEGNTHNLYSYLEAGKTVILDVSATWCGPCWVYKSSHALKDLYTKHGPAGTCSQDVIVLFIEGDTTTLTEALYGLGSDFTMGDWVSGTPYPIIDLQLDTNSINFLNNYPLEGFPTLFRICPDKKIYEFSYYIDGTVPNMESAIATCTPTALDAGISSDEISISCINTITPLVKLKNSGSTTINNVTFNYSIDGGAYSSYSFSGSLPSGEDTMVTFPNITGVSNGYHSIYVNVTSVNGGADGNQVNNCLTIKALVDTSSTVVAPYVQDFSSGSFPYTGWIIENLDNDTTWRRESSIGDGCIMLDNGYILPGSQDGFYLTPIDISGISNPELSFDLAYALFDSNYSETLQVFATKDCGENWIKVYEKTGLELSTAGVLPDLFTPTADSQWRKEHISLSSVSGSDKVILKVLSTSSYCNAMFIDNLYVGSATTSIDNLSNIARDLKIFPNPSTENTIISMMLNENKQCTITVADALGKNIFTMSDIKAHSGLFQFSIDTKQFTSGIYFVIIQIDDAKATLKFIKN